LLDRVNIWYRVVRSMLWVGF
jgi:hypothetical protein